MFNTDNQDKNEKFRLKILSPRPKLSQTLHSLQFSGSLQCEVGNTYLYLKISDKFIYDLFPFVEDPKALMPDYFFSKNAIGAHISIVYPGELIASSLSSLNLTLKQEFSFAITGFAMMTAPHKTYYVLLVASQSLNQLRQDLGLPAELTYRGVEVPMHITIAVKPSEG